jgi:hypothetical protein
MMNEVFEAIKCLDQCYDEPIINPNDAMINYLLVMKKLAFHGDKEDVSMMINKLVFSLSGKHTYEF